MSHQQYWSELFQAGKAATYAGCVLLFSFDHEYVDKALRPFPPSLKRNKAQSQCLPDDGQKADFWQLS